MEDGLDALVTDGTLTAEQRDSILTLFEKAQKSGDSPSLAALIENGTLTEEEKSEVEKRVPECPHVDEGKVGLR